MFNKRITVILHFALDMLFYFGIMNLLQQEEIMGPIDVEGKSASTNQKEHSNTETLESLNYAGFDKEVYKHTDANGEVWIQQVVAERMLNVRTRQFDLYCLCGSVPKSRFEEIVPNGVTILNDLLKEGILEEINSKEVRLKGDLNKDKSLIQDISKNDFEEIMKILQRSQNEAVEKKRVHTGHYSFNFIKESDIYRIAESKGKVVRVLLQDLATTDPNKKTLSTGDLSKIIDKEVEQKGGMVLQEYRNLINELNTSNTNLNSEVINLSKDKNKLVEEKYQILDKKRKWQISTILCSVALVIGGGVLYSTNKDNDRLYDVKKNLTGTIISLNAENSNLNVKTKMQGDEIEILKKQIPVTQNTEINAVKKD
jgi:hypothetical protein